MLTFDVLQKGLALASPPHFMYDFTRRVILMLYSIKRPNFTLSMPLLLEIFGYACITTACFPRCNVINFEINLTFLIELFFYRPKS